MFHVGIFNAIIWVVQYVIFQVDFRASVKCLVKVVRIRAYLLRASLRLRGLVALFSDDGKARVPAGRARREAHGTCRPNGRI